MLMYEFVRVIIPSLENNVVPMEQYIVLIFYKTNFGEIYKTGNIRLTEYQS